MEIHTTNKKGTKSKKYHTDSTVLKYNRKTIERDQIDSPNTQTHDMPFSKILWRLPEYENTHYEKMKKTK